MSEDLAQSYDAVPYRGHAVPASHPDAMAVIATLFGMQPTPADRCRVLELGCATGANLIPMALQLPQSAFTGVDFSAVQVERAQALAGRLGLRNIRLLRQSILELDEGEYDYIVCHGVYSWVPDPVKEKILAICARQLAPQGVAYVSYNTYPGWHLRGMVRDMMLYHTQAFAEPAQKAAQARALLAFLAQNAAQDSAYGRMLREEIESLRRYDDTYLLHEHLEENNHPLYFHEFVARAGGHGLRYLGDAQLGMMMTTNFPLPVRAALAQLSADLVRSEQVMDFLRNRTFRQTLLCRGGAPLTRTIEPRLAERFLIASGARPAPASVSPLDGSRLPERFATSAGAYITPAHPLISAALHCLAQAWPQALGFEELLAEAAQRAGIALQAAHREFLATELVSALTAAVVEFRLARPAFVTRPGDRPVASALARIQAETDALVTNLRHETVQLDDSKRSLLRLLDGEHDRAALGARLATNAEALARALETLARSALLCA